MNERGSGVGMFFLGILTGAIVGGVTALLLTPKTGKETRQLIKDKTLEMRDMMQDRWTDYKDRVTRAGQCLRTSTEKEPTAGNGQ